MMPKLRRNSIIQMMTMKHRMEARKMMHQMTCHHWMMEKIMNTNLKGQRGKKVMIRSNLENLMSQISK